MLDTKEKPDDGEGKEQPRNTRASTMPPPTQNHNPNHTHQLNPQATPFAHYQPHPQQMQMQAYPSVYAPQMTMGMQQMQAHGQVPSWAQAPFAPQGFYTPQSQGMSQFHQHTLPTMGQPQQAMSEVRPPMMVPGPMKIVPSNVERAKTPVSRVGTPGVTTMPTTEVQELEGDSVKAQLEEKEKSASKANSQEPQHGSEGDATEAEAISGDLFREPSASHEVERPPQALEKQLLQHGLRFNPQQQFQQAQHAPQPQQKLYHHQSMPAGSFYPSAYGPLQGIAQYGQGYVPQSMGYHNHSQQMMYPLGAYMTTQGPNPSMQQTSPAYYQSRVQSPAPNLPDPFVTPGSPAHAYSRGYQFGFQPPQVGHVSPFSPLFRQPVHNTGYPGGMPTTSSMPSLPSNRFIMTPSGYTQVLNQPFERQRDFTPQDGRHFIGTQPPAMAIHNAEDNEAAADFIIKYVQRYKNNPAAMETFSDLCEKYNTGQATAAQFYIGVYTVLYRTDGLNAMLGDFQRFMPRSWMSKDLDWFHRQIEKDHSDFAREEQDGSLAGGLDAAPNGRKRKASTAMDVEELSKRLKATATGLSNDKAENNNKAPKRKRPSRRKTPAAGTAEQTVDPKSSPTPTKRSNNRSPSVANLNDTPTKLASTIDEITPSGSFSSSKKGKHSLSTKTADRVTHYGPIYPTRRSVLSRTDKPYIHQICGKAYVHPQDCKSHHAACIALNGHKDIPWDAHPSCAVGYPDINYTHVQEGYVILNEEDWLKLEAANAAGRKFLAEQEQNSKAQDDSPVLDAHILDSDPPVATNDATHQFPPSSPPSDPLPTLELNSKPLLDSPMGSPIGSPSGAPVSPSFEALVMNMSTSPNVGDDKEATTSPPPEGELTSQRTQRTSMSPSPAMTADGGGKGRKRGAAKRKVVVAGRSQSEDGPGNDEARAAALGLRARK